MTFVDCALVPRWLIVMLIQTRSITIIVRKWKLRDVISNHFIPLLWFVLCVCCVNVVVWMISLILLFTHAPWLLCCPLLDGTFLVAGGGWLLYMYHILFVIVSWLFTIALSQGITLNNSLPLCVILSSSIRPGQFDHLHKPVDYCKLWTITWTAYIELLSIYNRCGDREDTFIPSVLTRP